MKSMLAAILFVAISATPGLANCYEDIGCTDSEIFSKAALRPMSCQILWEVRNQIYHENGYCFQTDRGRAAFSNDGCHESDQGAIKLNSYERSNVKRIRQVEIEKGC